MEPKFKVGDEVIVSGTLTGIGDIKGCVTEQEFSSLTQEYFYNVKSDLKGYWSQERFLKFYKEEK